jgi:preprotein translocase subunit SecY
MIATVVNIFRIQDLRNKILFTVALLIIYRVGFHIPVPCYDQSKIADITKQRDTEGPLGRAAEYMQMFTGGTLEKSSLFGLGIMPYITSSIILMLLGEVIPALKKLRRYSIDNVYEVVGRGRIDLSGYGASGHDNGYCRYDGRHRLSDVAWRADR